jgi:hypothetical protein
MFHLLERISGKAFASMPSACAAESYYGIPRPVIIAALFGWQAVGSF